MREDPFIPKESEIKDSDETTETKENIEQNHKKHNKCHSKCLAK